MKVELVDIKTLNHLENNPRRLSKEDFEHIKKSIETFGFVENLVVNSAPGREGVIIGGNQRFEVAKKLGFKEVPVHYVNITDLKKEQELSIRLNRNMGEFDFDILANNFEEEDLLAWGFKPEELGKFFEDDSEEVNPTPSVPKEAISRIGEVYNLGIHRLMCGDSTNPSDVAVLMDGKIASLMNTDPPYGIDFVKLSQSKGQSQEYKDIENDDLVDGEKLQEFLESAIRTAIPHLIENVPFYLWHPMLTQGTFFAAAAAAAAAADILINRQIIWVKPSMVFGRGDYHWKHELCFYGWRRGHKPVFYGERNQTTVWNIDRENNKIHPTQKPVELFKIPISNHTKEGEIIYEPFGGSGTQFIAAEMTGRICYGLEISPFYCDVIISRWCNHTGSNIEDIYGQSIRKNTDS